MNAFNKSRLNGVQLTLMACLLASCASVSQDERSWYCEMRSMAFSGDQAAISQMYHFVAGVGERSRFVSNETSRKELALLLRTSVSKADPAYSSSYLTEALIRGWVGSSPQAVPALVGCIENAGTSAQIEGCMAKETWWAELHSELIHQCPLN